MADVSVIKIIDGTEYDLDIAFVERGGCSILYDGKSFNAEFIRSESGKKYKVSSGDLTPFGFNFMTGQKADGIDVFSLDFDDYGFVWNFVTRSGREEKIRFSTSGTRFTNLLGKKEDMTQLYLGDAYWKDENTLVMHGRWVETCIQDTYVLKFDGDSLSVEPDNNSAFRFFKPEPIVIEKL